MEYQTKFCQPILESTHIHGFCLWQQQQQTHRKIHGSLMKLEGGYVEENGFVSVENGSLISGNRGFVVVTINGFGLIWVVFVVEKRREHIRESKDKDEEKIGKIERWWIWFVFFLGFDVVAIVMLLLCLGCFLMNW